MILIGFRDENSQKQNNIQGMFVSCYTRKLSVLVTDFFFVKFSTPHIQSVSGGTSSTLLKTALTTIYRVFNLF